MKPGYIKAAVLEELNKPLQIRTLKLPELKDGQVLVKILYSGVCRSQLMEARGGRGDDPWLPHLLGHEASGVVADCGAGVTK
ncbi:MAG: alcohol dehydrogenase catalytic domain-containing protein, partial [Leptospiraceae bacterium]|nr:alcohol dehydrogenase catalytic domain-containing protein [Leptospiraceae bacterium]